jgi:hypothetical protein
VYEFLGRQPTRRRRKPRELGLIAPPLEAGSLASVLATNLLPELRSRADIDMITVGDSTDPAAGARGAARIQVRADAIERAIGGYKRVLYCVDGDRTSAGVVAAALARGGVVIAVDPQFSRLYEGCSAEKSILRGRSFREAVSSMYPMWSEKLDSTEMPDARSLERAGVLMSAEILAAAEKFFVLSEYAAHAVRLDAPDGIQGRIVVLPLAVPQHGATAPARHVLDQPLIIGFVDDCLGDQLPRLLGAAASLRDHLPGIRLVISCTPNGAGHLRLRTVAAQLGLDDVLEYGGSATPAVLRRWLRQATVTLHLCDRPPLVPSLACLMSLATETPMIVTQTGAHSELPGDVAVFVGTNVSVGDLATLTRSVIVDQKRRDDLGRGAQHFVEEHSHAQTAAARLEALP